MCEEAHLLVAALCAEASVAFEVRDVDADPSCAQWSDHVPVVLVDGVRHAQWWVSEPELRRVLQLPV